MLRYVLRYLVRYVLRYLVRCAARLQVLGVLPRDAGQVGDALTNLLESRVAEARGDVTPTRGASAHRRDAVAG